MTQISLRDITLSYGSAPLIKASNLFIQEGDRIALIGRNGAGKSTLLKLILGQVEADEGIVEYQKSIKIVLLQQNVPQNIAGTVEDIIAKPSSQDWKVASLLSKLQLEGSQIFNHLSGGMKRLVLLASLLIQEPNVLLLDEPTNHLDIDKIILLEKILLDFKGTVLFVTHDRTLLQKLANFIVEIDNGELLSWRGEFSKYLEHRETQLIAEEKASALFDKKLAEEEKWIRRGIKARRTRNEGRVRLLKKMREEKTQRRVRIGQVNLTDNALALSGKKVFEIANISFSYDNKCIIKNFSTTILRGDKIAIIGPNGSGKTTLINLILGKLTPDSGKIEQGTQLEIGFFDQLRETLDENKTILDYVSELGDTIQVGTQQKHIMSYLRDYLFTPSRARTKIANLSGGEKNRVLLAKLFTKPCNVLVLDEPTNDLDIETLEILENKLVEFSGTILLISHDRTFLNNVATSTIVFQPGGHLEEYVGGYDDLRINQTLSSASITSNSLSKKSSSNKISTKLSYQEKKTLLELPEKIESLEKRQQIINQQLADPLLYKNAPDTIILLNKELKEIETQLIDYFNLWENLEKKEIK